MKNINIFSKVMMAAVLVLGLTSCNEFLNREPLAAISPDGYYSTDAQLDAAIMREYYNILPGNGTYSYGLLGNDSGTDNQVTLTISSKYLDGQWKVGSGNAWSFSAVYYINYFLEQALPKYEAGQISGNANNIKHYIGEAYFLRAYWYFSQLKNLGDFPIVKECLPDDMEVLTEASKRAPQNEVARFILEDLDKAIEFMSATDLSKSRINKDAALLFKSRVALYEGTWLKNFAGTAFVPGGAEWPGGASYSYPSGSVESEWKWFLGQAADAAKQVGDKYVGRLAANTGKMQQSVDEAANEYYDMFASESLNGIDEVIMQREYSFSYSKHAVPQAAARGNYKIGLTRAYVQNFLMLDGTPVYKHGTYADGDGYYMGDKTLADVRTNRDTRLSIFLKAPGDKNVLYNIGDPVGTEVVEVQAAPAITDGDGERGYSTGYSLHKGGCLDVKHYGNNGGYTAAVIFRAAEALLNYIEASYTLNGTIDATADSYWKALRARAKVDTDYNKTIAATDMAEEAKFDWAAYTAGQVIADKTLYNIRRERRCELLSEGFRMDDLRRWRALDQLCEGGAQYGYQIEGFHLWNTPMEGWYNNLKADPTDDNSNVSSKEFSEYLRPFQTYTGKNGFNGVHWHMAHYLNPIGVGEMLLTSPSGDDASQSVIYQNPYWPVKADQGATK